MRDGAYVLWLTKLLIHTKKNREYRDGRDHNEPEGGREDLKGKEFNCICFWMTGCSLVVGSPAIHSLPEPETRGRSNNPLSPVYPTPYHFRSFTKTHIVPSKISFLLPSVATATCLRSGFSLPITWIIAIASFFSCLHIHHCCQEFFLNDLS